MYIHNVYTYNASFAKVELCSSLIYDLICRGKWNVLDYDFICCENWYVPVYDLIWAKGQMCWFITSSALRGQKGWFKTSFDLKSILLEHVSASSLNPWIFCLPSLAKLCIFWQCLIKHKFPTQHVPKKNNSIFRHYGMKFRTMSGRHAWYLYLLAKSNIH